MMNYLKPSLVVALAVFTFVQGCTKKSDDPSPGQSSSVSTDVCKGNSGNNYFPLTKGDQRVMLANPGGDTYTYKIVLDTNQAWNGSGPVYHTVKQRSQSSISVNSPTDKYYRLDANGDIYAGYSDQASNEELLIPATPSVGQNWLGVTSSGYTDSFAVSSTTASFTTSSCTYQDLLVINKYSKNGSTVYLQQKNYYKKGLGLVRYETYSNNTYIGNYTISSVSIH